MKIQPRDDSLCDSSLVPLGWWSSNVVEWITGLKYRSFPIRFTHVEISSGITLGIGETFPIRDFIHIYFLSFVPMADIIGSLKVNLQ